MLKYIANLSLYKAEYEIMHFYYLAGKKSMLKDIIRNNEFYYLDCFILAAEERPSILSNSKYVFDTIVTSFDLDIKDFASKIYRYSIHHENFTKICLEVLNKAECVDYTFFTKEIQRCSELNEWLSTLDI